MMVPPPDAHHLAGNLARIAERAGVRSYNFMSALARVAVRVFALILADATTTIRRLAFSNNVLPDPIVRKLLKCVGLYSGKIRIMHWRLGVKRCSERAKHHGEQKGYDRQLHGCASLAEATQQQRQFRARRSGRPGSGANAVPSPPSGVQDPTRQVSFSCVEQRRELLCRRQSVQARPGYHHGSCPNVGLAATDPATGKRSNQSHPTCWTQSRRRK